MPRLYENVYFFPKAFVQPDADSFAPPFAILLSSGFLIIPDLLLAKESTLMSVGDSQLSNHY